MRDSKLAFFRGNIEKIVNVLKENLSITSYGITDNDIYSFAGDICENYLSYDIARYLDDPAINVAISENNKITDKVQDRLEDYARCYNGMNAIIYYRIAHKLLTDENWFSSAVDEYDDIEDEWLNNDEDEGVKRQFFIELSKKMSECAAKETGIEINPSASIGKGFVIDHGMKVKIGVESDARTTVIGETCVIGENCTILNDVILGASNLKNNSGGKRHPTIGNNVIIAAGVRVFGDVVIGNDVFISPYCIVTSDIPDNTTVLLVNQLQIERNTNREKVNIYGLIPHGKGIFTLYGDKLIDKSIKLIDEHYDKIDCCDINIINQNDIEIKFELILKDICSLGELALEISSDSTSVFYVNSRVLSEYLKSIGG